jgi:hypothetical protein
MLARPAILERLKGVQRAGTGWLAFCPAHNDQNKRSLSVGVGEDGRTLVKCHAAGCPAEEITAAVDMTLADLAPPASRTNGHRRREVAAYDYRDERGRLLSQNVRFDPKDFRQRRPNGRGGWIWNMDGVRRVPYRLSELAEQPRIFIVEGEKDCDALWTLELAATTNAAGAGKWSEEHTAALVALTVPEVVVLPDNDVPGEKHAIAVAASCRAAGLQVKLVRLSGLPPKGDVSDWLAAGHGKAELLALIDAAPIFTEAVVAGDGSGEPQLLREGLDLALVWPAERVRFALTAIHDSRSGVVGELTVLHADRRLHWGAFSLSATSARETLRKKLEHADSRLPWGDYLEEVAYQLTHAAREGEPIVALTGRPASQTRALMPRLLYEGEPTLIFGDGDTGKSLTALTIAISVHAGVTLPGGFRPERAMPVAYLDWETSRDTIDARLGAIASGLGIDPPPLLYKRMTRPLVDVAATLAAEFARHHVGLVVIDSKMFAVGSGDGVAFHEPITCFYNALALFSPAAPLVLNHVTNADAKNGAPARPFGGAFAFNGPRLIWEAKRDRDVTDATAIAFTCIKANNLPRIPDPFGLRFQPGDGTITVYPFDLTEATPNVVAGASLTFRISLALGRGLSDPEVIAKELGKDTDTVKRLLRRLRFQGKAKDRPDGGWELIR